jgi:hypothetical protein
MGALMGVGLSYIVAFVIGVTAADNLTIISMNGAGDGENLVHIVTGVTALAAGLLSSGAEHPPRHPHLSGGPYAHRGTRAAARARPPAPPLHE